MGNHRKLIWIGLFFVLALATASCAPASVVEEVVEAPSGAMPEVEAAPAEAEPMVELREAEQPAAVVERAVAAVDPALLPEPNRLIIKDGELKLEVDNTDVAIDRVTQIGADLGGYVISSQSSILEVNGQNYKYATITLGVPSGEFETAMRRLRAIARQVLNESSSGQDVTDEYVDQQSRLDNLKATRDRIREFLKDAKTVEEALKVNEQLKEVEDEIEQVQGRMNYLFDRAAYSTLTVILEPYILPVTPTATPTPTITPTPTPTLTPTPWQPGETFRDASGTLGTVFRWGVDTSIYAGVVCLPFLIPLGLLIWLGVWLRRKIRGRRKPAVWVPQPEEPAPQDQ